MKLFNKTILGALLGASAIVALPTVVQADGYNNGRVVIYFTRHAEKQTVLDETPPDSGMFIERCAQNGKCAEELNPAGQLRADLLADWFYFKGITQQLTHAFSSHKDRTRQTIEQIVEEAQMYNDLAVDVDKITDGIQEYPVRNDDDTDFATELDPTSTSGSEGPTIDALLNLPAGSVALVAGHSGTLYDIMSGIGLDDACVKVGEDGNGNPIVNAECNADRYPFKPSDLKVSTFGDIWKVTLRNGGSPNGGVTRFNFRKNLTFGKLIQNNIAR